MAGTFPSLAFDSSRTSTESLLARYGAQPVPRYTSYPPANHWQDRIGPDEAREALSRAGGRPLSLYVHVPFCRSLCLYCGCNMLVTRSEPLVERYLAALESEIALAARELPERGRVVQVHLGGGTPTFLGPDQLARVATALRRHFDWREGIEASIEVHPPVTTVEQIETLARIGFNRVSMGVQDFDPRVQERIRRRQPFDQTRALVLACREAGFLSVNVDLMYGLPLQTVERFQATLDRVEELRPDRVAIFGYAHVPTVKRHQRVFQAEELPDASLRLELLETAIARLEGAGYRHVGLDHFALESDELAIAQDGHTLRRNFMGYTTCADSEVLAFGPSAISEVSGTFIQNERDVRAWADCIEAGRLSACRGHRASDEDLARQELIMELFCNLEVDLSAVRARHPHAFPRGFLDESPALAELAEDGLVSLSGSRVRVMPVGQRLLRTVASVFDTYARHDGSRTHAPAV